MAASDPSPSRRRWRLALYPTLPLLLWIALTALTMYLFPRQGAQPFREFRLGEISPEEIIAPFTFDLLKSDEELETERSAVRDAVEPVFVVDDSVAERMQARLSATADQLRLVAREITRNDTINDPLGSYGRGMLNVVRTQYDVTLNEPTWRYLITQMRGDTLPVREGIMRTILRDIYSRGVLDVPVENIDATSGEIRVISHGEEQTVEPERLFDLESAHEEVPARLADLLDIDLASQDTTLKVGYELLASFIRPNLLYDEAETVERKERAVAQVPIVKGTVFKDERIIDSNERVREEHLEKLRSLKDQMEIMAGREEGFWPRVWPWVGRFLFAGSIFLFFGYWIRRFLDDIWSKPNQLLLVGTVLFGMIAMYGFVFVRQDLSLYLYPSALGAVILAIAFQARVALIYAVVLALIVGGLSGRDLFPALVVLLPSAISIFSVLRVRTRLQIMRSALLIFAGAAVALMIDRTMTLQFDETVLHDLTDAAIAAVSTPLVALGLLLVIEPLYKVTSDLTLLELADLNRPLLKRLSLEAPGTYHHSIMVGNLAESAAEQIEANPLLVRAGAYYHDVGKMARRDYFVENQLSGGNIHDQLEPEESARMLADHVIKGVEIADKFRVPEKIKEFIREHHGTSLMVFFYNKALEMRPEGTVNEDDFRYPGPKPQSRETGILMLADSAEAATRSLEDPAEENIRKVVREVIIAKYRDGELDECPLTLHDLGEVMNAFVPILRGMHHHRIRYPNREEMEQRRERSRAAKAAREADPAPASDDSESTQAEGGGASP